MTQERIDRIESRMDDFERRLLVLEVTSAERHTATLGAIGDLKTVQAASIKELKEAQSKALDEVKKAIWWLITTGLVGLGGIATAVLLHGLK